MKTKVLIIEDNFCKFFATKQVLEAQLKVEVATGDVDSGAELVAATNRIDPDLIFCRPEGGVVDLLEKMKKRQTNRRNTEITLLLAEECDGEVVRRFQLLIERHMQRSEATDAAAA